MRGWRRSRERAATGGGGVRRGDRAERGQFQRIRSLTPLYWERPLLVLVQYQGIGVAILNLNTMDIQTAEFKKYDSNSNSET
jgi:hypothetical protein